MKDKLTKRQQSVLRYIEDYLAKHGYPPSIREIGLALGIKSLRGVTVHLDALERKGYIRRESTSRSIQVLKTLRTSETGAFALLPIVGTIAAGRPLLAVENIEGEISVPRTMLGATKGAFALRVKGDSMIDAHILDKDLVVIRPQPTAENGDLVAALLGDEATVKHLRIKGEEAVLMPANSAYQPISLQNTDVRLIGKVIGLLRSY